MADETHRAHEVVRDIPTEAAKDPVLIALAEAEDRHGRAVEPVSITGQEPDGIAVLSIIYRVAGDLHLATHVDGELVDSRKLTRGE
jgi:hypothetical protein